MKKILIYLLFVFTILFCSSLNNKLLADNSNYNLHGYDDFHILVDGGNTNFVYNNYSSVFHNNQLSNYFFNLDNNIPSNVAGSCGYVSQAMLLGYFDSFYSDLIVDDNLINKANISSFSEIYTKSPGHHNDYFSYINDDSAVPYYNYIMNNPTKSLHFNLIVKAREIGLIPNKFTSIDTLPGTDIYGTDHLKIHNSLNYYLQEKNVDNLFISNFVNNFPTNDDWDGPIFSEEYQLNSQLIEEEILDYIFNGIPVIVGIAYFGNSSYSSGLLLHAAIAYDYYVTDSGIKLVFNFGLQNGNNCGLLSGNYCYTGYNVLIPINYANHVCSDNYIYNNQGICPCQFENHQHNYVRYTKNNNLKHNKICYCGYSVQEMHHMNSGVQGNYCSLCGYLANNDIPIIINKIKEEISDD